jgi:hypothetical protein
VVADAVVYNGRVFIAALNENAVDSVAEDVAVRDGESVAVGGGASDDADFRAGDGEIIERDIVRACELDAV